MARFGAVGIAAMAVRLGGRTDLERQILAQGGFGSDVAAQEGYVLLHVLGAHAMTYDPWMWASLGYGGRTMQAAHGWVQDHWEQIAADGSAIVDVREILGE